MNRVAFVLGVGPGLGAALGRPPGRGGFRVLWSRGSPENLSEPALDPDRMAEAYFQLVEQDRSDWTLEPELRPHREKFFE